MTGDLTRVPTVKHALAATITDRSLSTFSTGFDAAVLDYPRRIALRFRGTALSYTTLAARVQAASSVLLRLGSGPGVCIGLLLPNCPAVIVYTLAAFATGATIAALNPTGDGDDLALIAEQCGMTLLITCNLASCQAGATRVARAGAIEAVIVVSYAGMLTMAGATALRLLGANQLGVKLGGLACPVHWERDLLRDKSAETVGARNPLPRAATLDDAAFLVTAPGNQGLTMTVLSHANLASSIVQINAAMPPPVGVEDRIVVALPIWHSLSWTVAASLTIARGSELTLSNEHDVSAVIGDMKNSRPTVLVVPAPMLATLLATARVSPLTFEGLRYVLIVGGAVTPALATAFGAVSNAPLLECYSPTNLPVPVAVTQVEGASGSATGKLVIGTHACVRDLADLAREVPRGERGELCVTGPQIPVPNQRLPTASLSVGTDLRSGDLATIDTSGRIVVIDRVDDLIIAAGYLIYPRRIEAALIEHPGVTDAAVIGIDDGKRGQAPKAFVVLKRGLAITERDLRLFLAEKISKIEMPADIDFITSLPRTPFGLVCKPTLRRQEAVRRAKKARSGAIEIGACSWER